MPKLILLNGPPAVGKSTLARRYADAHPMTLVLEIDAVRALLGSWLEEWQQSGHLARVIALAMARTHLEAGHDVIVPQLLTRRPFVEMLQETAEASGATFVEFALLDSREVVLARLEERSEAEGGFSSRALMEKQGNEPGDAYDAFVAALAERPDAIVIGEPLSDAAYESLLRLLD
ncbi:MAG: AAA family ATPase [Gaiellaceae bacterium]